LTHNPDTISWSLGGFTIRLTPEAHQHLIQLCKTNLPNEACGVLAGTRKRPSLQTASNLAYQFRTYKSDGVSPTEELFIDAVYPIQNASRRRTHSFSFDPQSWVAAFYAIQQSGREMAGFYHTHPTASAVPSLQDLEGLRHTHASTYWIISFIEDQKEPVVQPYLVYEKALQPLHLSHA